MITICKNIKPFSVFQRNGETEGVAFDVVHALKILQEEDLRLLYSSEQKAKVASRREHRKPHLRSQHLLQSFT